MKSFYQGVYWRKALAYGVFCSLAAAVVPLAFAEDDRKISIVEEAGASEVPDEASAAREASGGNSKASSEAIAPSDPTDTLAEQIEDAQAAGVPPLPPQSAEPLADDTSPSPPERAFDILNTQVLPGTAQRLAWSPAVTFSGIAVPTPVLIVHGAKAGPVLCLTAAVHGDELNGIEIVRRAMFDLDPKQLSGTVIGVPIVNLDGFRRASRYLTDRRDLNRYFPGYAHGSSASRIAYSFFSEVVQHCTMLVDLHTGSFKRTNLPQLRADLNYPEVAELSKKMGSIVVLQSQGARGSLRRAAVEAGVPAVTLEAGEPHTVQLDAVHHGVRSIENLLHKSSMYKQRGLFARGAEPVFYKSTWVRAQSGGVLVSNILLGERVKTGQILGNVTDPITNLREAIVSPHNGRVIGMALNQVMMPGFAAYHIGYQSTVEEATETDAGPDDAAGDETELEASDLGLSGADEGNSVDGERD